MKKKESRFIATQYWNGKQTHNKDGVLYSHIYNMLLIMVAVEINDLCKCLTFSITTHHINASMQFNNILATVSCLHVSSIKIKYSAIPYSPPFLLFLFQIHIGGPDNIAI